MTADRAVVKVTAEAGVGLITIDNPPVNALCSAVREALVSGLDDLAARDEVTAIVIACAGDTFVVGADLQELGGGYRLTAQTVNQLVEDCPKTVVAAIHGRAFGAGLELALACHYRIATPDALLAFPEVKLGLVPGGGGTQRAPRLIGAERALQMIMGGEPVSARTAREWGLIDELAEGQLASYAVQYAAAMAKPRERPPRASELTGRLSEVGPQTFATAVGLIPPPLRPLEAPLRCLEAVKAAVEMPFEQGLLRERELFEEAEASLQSRALRHVFLAERRAARVPDVPKGAAALPVRRVGIVGGGVMGAGIAICCADRGLPVVIVEQDDERVDACLTRASSHYQSAVLKNRLSAGEAQERLALIRCTAHRQALSQADLVIEAVFEDMSLKRDVFAWLDRTCRPDAVLASNTSSLDLDRIADSVARPERVVGLHFFNPADRMRLVEIVRGGKTAPTVIATALRVVKQLGKVGVVVRVGPGFVGNRMFHQYRREAFFLAEEGAPLWRIDTVLTDFGMPIGPFALSDLIGLDVSYAVRRELGRTPGERYSATLADRLAEAGRAGRKTGLGFYRYDSDKRQPIADPVVESMLVDVSRELGIRRRTVSDTEIIERCLYAAINEGARILEEGKAIRSSDMDVIWVLGYGFPSYRGGPMFHADSVGLDVVHDRIRAYRDAHGQLWEPAALLSRLASEGRGFSDFDPLGETA